MSIPNDLFIECADTLLAALAKDHACAGGDMTNCPHCPAHMILTLVKGVSQEKKASEAKDAEIAALKAEVAALKAAVAAVKPAKEKPVKEKSVSDQTLKIQIALKKILREGEAIHCSFGKKEENKVYSGVHADGLLDGQTPSGWILAKARIFNEDPEYKVVINGWDRVYVERKGKKYSLDTLRKLLEASEAAYSEF